MVESNFDFRSLMKLFPSNVLWSLYRAFIIWDFKLTAVNLWKPDIVVCNIHVVLKYTFLFLMIGSMQEGDTLASLSDVLS